MRRLKVGVIGCANIAERMVLPAMRSMEEWELAAVASRSLEKAKRFAGKFNCEPIENYESLLEREDIEAVYIPLPNALHYEWVMKALARGKHCLVEKPMGCDYASVKNMVETARHHQVCLFENFMLVYHSQHDFIREKLKDNEIGEIRCFRCSFGFPPLSKDNIRYDKALGGGALLDAGGYLLKACQLMEGDGPPLTVTAAYLKIDPGTGVDIYGGAFLSNRQGLFAQIAFGFDNFYQCNYEIWGSKGKITAHRAFTAGPGIKPKVVIEKQDVYDDLLLPPDNHFVNILWAFYRSITQKDAAREGEYKKILRQAALLKEVQDNARKN